MGEFITIENSMLDFIKYNLLTIVNYIISVSYKIKI